MKKWVKKLEKFLIIFGVLFLVFYLYTSYINDGFFYYLLNKETGPLLSFISSFKNLSAIIFIFFIILGIVFAPISPLLFYVVGAKLFGPFLAGTLALIGNIIGSSICFNISRFYGKKHLHFEMEERTEKKFKSFVKKYGPYSVFLLKINPVTSSDLIDYLAGFTQMKFSKFLLWNALGVIPLIYLQTYLGKTFLDNKILLLISMIFGAIYFILFIFGLLYIHKKKKKMKESLNRLLGNDKL